VLKAGLGTRPTGSVSQAEAGSAATSSFEAQYVPPTPDELAPHFPDLEILELVGRGGMGVVYKARQKRLDRLVALKILAPKIGQDPAFAERFAREARAMAMLGHPHIVAVHDFGETDGLYYFLMEFVDGVNLRRLLDTGKLAPEAALAIVPQICEALQYAHDHGVVHRDIKPENVLLDKEGRVKIADFGIAKLVGREAKDLSLTGEGQIVGTPQYMAPEQIEHPLQVDHRADLYSLGVVFYQMLTGELPIGRFALPSKKVQIDVRLDDVVLRALEKEPERRYQQASEIKTEVESIVTTPGGAEEAAGQRPVASPPRKTSLCYLSTPEHLRSFRGRFFWIYKGKGELRLDNEALSFHSDWPTVRIPLSAIYRIAQGDYPYSAKPSPLQYIEVTFAEHDEERTLLFTPVARAVMLPTEANRIGEEWLSALQEAIRAAAGRTLSVERSHVAQDKLWWAKTLFLMVLQFTAIFSAIPIIKDHRLPSWGEFVFGPIFGAVMTAVTLLGLWERRRRAMISGDLDSLTPQNAQTDLPREPRTPTTDQPRWSPPDSGWGWLVGKVFGVTFTSRWAYRCANLSALGFLGFLGFMPLPGWQVCFVFFGFFGLIGVAHLSEALARSDLTTGKMFVLLAVLAVAIGMLVPFLLTYLRVIPPPKSAATPVVGILEGSDLAPGKPVKSVHLAGWFVTDAALEHLQGFTQLQSLNLANSQVTDAGLERLKGLTRLRSLCLGETKVTDDGKKKLRLALPNCEIR
jgi:serine/threonine protein kinase